MSPPTNKRRKVGDSSNVLFKPFKSPMKVSGIGSTESPPKPQDSTTRKQDSSPRFAERLKQIKPESRNSNQSDEFSRLRKDELALLSQISTLKAELGQIKQAHSIESSNRETELLDLIKTWRNASQQAAEECYAIFRDKVNSVGGLRRWNEAEKARKDNAFSSWGLEEEIREGSDNQEQDPELPVSQEAHRLSEEESTTTEPATLSMDVMLRYMAIDPSIIGYDIDNQRWVSD